jgi:hypothetical protein
MRRNVREPLDAFEPSAMTELPSTMRAAALTRRGGLWVPEMGSWLSDRGFRGRVCRLVFCIT